MTDTVGETFLVEHTAMKTDEVPPRPLVADDVDHVSVIIYNRDYSAVVVEEATMDWDEENSRWLYEWRTTDATPGTYFARCTVHGIAGSLNWEDLKIRLKRDRAAAIGDA